MIYTFRSSSLPRIRAITFPPLSYGISRNIDVEWLAPFVYGLGFIGLITLVVLNVAVTTYDAIITTTENFNATQVLWYHRFTGRPEPGSQCSSYNITVGQQFTTTTNVLTYTLLTIEGNKRILPYAGVAINNCDVVSTAVDVDLAATTVTSIAYVACNVTGLQITAKTEYIWSLLPSLEGNGRLSPGQCFFEVLQSGARNYAAFAFDAVSGDLMTLLQVLSIRQPTIAPGRISIEVVPSCSPHPYYSAYAPIYCKNDNTVPVTWLYGGGTQEYYFGFSNGTELPAQYDTNNQNQTVGYNWVNLGLPYDFSEKHITGTYLPAITNVLQVLISAVRLDFGHILPNNPFLSPTMMNETLQDPFHDGINVTNWADTIRPLTTQFGPAHMEDFLLGNSTYINGEYQCRFWYPIGWVQAIVNVMVATLSLFTTGWGIGMLVIAFLVNQKAEDNYCAGYLAALNSGASDSRALRESEKDGSPTESEEGGLA